MDSMGGGAWMIPMVLGTVVFWGALIWFGVWAVRRFTGRPRGDEFVSYLEEHAKQRRIDLMLETEVERIERSDHLWRLETSRGPMFAHSVVVATGVNCVPRIPPWPGREEFTGELLHSSRYRNA